MTRIMIAGTHSGCGKTTVTCAVLSALKARRPKVAAFKCGPDYIDPLFHREALGVPSHNLDPFFCSGGQLRSLLSAGGGAISVIEGAMGYYDGIGPAGEASSYACARATDTPVALVVDASGVYASAGAILQGYRDFRPGAAIRGVIFNNAPPQLYPGLCRLAEQAGVRPLGFLPRRPELSVGSRHLGLIAPGEIADIRAKLRSLGELAFRYLDLEGLAALAAAAPPLPAAAVPPQPLAKTRIAVARDRAFCFLYQENLELLESLGCALAYFSPLNDPALPERIGGLYLPGGYPELHVEALSNNTSMLRSIGEAVAAGLPTVAECGGFLYLHESLDDVPLAGVIRARAYKTRRLQRFGYCTLTAETDNLLCAAGDILRAHEYHYYESEDPGKGFMAAQPMSGRSWRCVHATDTLYAGFPHLYFYANPALAKAFVRKAAAYASL